MGGVGVWDGWNGVNGEGEGNSRVPSITQFLHGSFGAARLALALALAALVACCVSHQHHQPLSLRGIHTQAKKKITHLYCCAGGRCGQAAARGRRTRPSSSSRWRRRGAAAVLGGGVALRGQDGREHGARAGKAKAEQRRDGRLLVLVLVLLVMVHRRGRRRRVVVREKKVVVVVVVGEGSVCVGAARRTGKRDSERRTGGGAAAGAQLRRLCLHGGTAAPWNGGSGVGGLRLLTPFVLTPRRAAGPRPCPRTRTPGGESERTPIRAPDAPADGDLSNTEIHLIWPLLCFALYVMLCYYIQAQANAERRSPQ